MYYTQEKENDERRNNNANNEMIFPACQLLIPIYQMENEKFSTKMERLTFLLKPLSMHNIDGSTSICAYVYRSIENKTSAINVWFPGFEPYFYGQKKMMKNNSKESHRALGTEIHLLSAM